MGKIIKIQFKNLVRNRLVYAYYFVLLLWYFMMHRGYIKNGSMDEILFNRLYQVTFGYAFLASFPMLIIISSDIFKNKIVLLGSNIKKDILSKICVCMSIVLINLGSCLILFLVYYLMSPVKFNQEYINQLIFVICDWGVVFLFSVAISTIIGQFFKSIFVYIISFISLFLLINEFRDSSVKLYRVFALTKTGYDVGLSSVFMNILTKDYVIHKFLMITISLFLIYISYIINKFKLKDMNKRDILGMCIGGLLIVMLVSYNKNYLPITYNQLIEKEAKVRYESNIDIKKYDMKISLDDYLKNECTITLDNLKDSQELKLRLNQIFEIQGIYAGDKKLEYKHENGILKVKIDKNIKDIKIVYKGYINVLGTLNEPIAFVTSKASFLPYDYLTWYPKEFDDKEKEYDIKVVSGNDVYVNLDNKIKNDKVYLFKGKAKDILLISGYLNDYKDKKIVCGRSNTIRYEYLKSERDGNYKDIVENNIKKTLLIPIDYRQYGDINRLYKNEGIIVYNSRWHE